MSGRISENAEYYSPSRSLRLLDLFAKIIQIRTPAIAVLHGIRILRHKYRFNHFLYVHVMNAAVRAGAELADMILAELPKCKAASLCVEHAGRRSHAVAAAVPRAGSIIQHLRFRTCKELQVPFHRNAVRARVSESRFGVSEAVAEIRHGKQLGRLSFFHRKGKACVCAQIVRAGRKGRRNHSRTCPKDGNTSRRRVGDGYRSVVGGICNISVACCADGIDKRGIARFLRNRRIPECDFGLCRRYREFHANFAFVQSDARKNRRRCSGILVVLIFQLVARALAYELSRIPHGNGRLFLLSVVCEGICRKRNFAVG